MPEMSCARSGFLSEALVVGLCDVRDKTGIALLSSWSREQQARGTWTEVGGSGGGGGQPGSRSGRAR
jgi:hypothetical protein